MRSNNAVIPIPVTSPIASAMPAFFSSVATRHVALVLERHDEAEHEQRGRDPERHPPDQAAGEREGEHGGHPDAEHAGPRAWLRLDMRPAAARRARSSGTRE